MQLDSALDGVGAEAAPGTGGEDRIGSLAASFVEPGFDDGTDQFGQRDGPLFASFAFAADMGAGSEHDVAAVESE